MKLSDVIRETPDGIEIGIFCRPKATKDVIAGIHGERLKVKVKAAPEQGTANRSLIQLIAKTLGVPRSQVRVTSGESSRIKRVHISGIDRASAEEAIEAVL